ncbi:aspartate--ammonia ligase [Mycoplasmopsis synoviae]|uniref:aspartate--ammonia ligase n=1 Tax=Mycoplasmopsis synoviae TaxID=2109 RepID=UPI000D212744|nr:aspartate--ammonia ligase [Mycoplasmopsis synoviae]AQU47880.1 Aspartate--ammonia ligase [Mycoplasmopsis synoviae]QLE13849.1 aspartate--ammonia ligase [Mycoplasmopsis synoviae]
MDKELNFNTYKHQRQDLLLELETNLVKKLNLVKKTPPVKLSGNFGNENNYVEFFVKDFSQYTSQLYKWNKISLKNFDKYEGLYNMPGPYYLNESGQYSYNAKLLSWAQVIDYSDRNLVFLKKSANKVFLALKATENFFVKKYSLSKKLGEKVFLITTDMLYKQYPNLDASQREDEITKEHKVVFVYKIGYNLPDKKPHSEKVFDDHDWKLNGDLFFYDEENRKAVKLASLGISVDEINLLKQKVYLKLSDTTLDRYHHEVLARSLPYSISGEIFQDQLIELLLGTKQESNNGK